MPVSSTSKPATLSICSDHYALVATIDVDAGAEVATFYADPTDFLSVKEALEAAGVEFVSAEIGYVPENDVAVESKEDAKKILKLVDALEDNDDVQNVFANYDIPDDWFAELQG